MRNRILSYLNRTGSEEQEQRRLFLAFQLAGLAIFFITSPRAQLGDLYFFGFIFLLLASIFFTYRGQLWLARMIMPFAAFLLITKLVYEGGINDEAVGGYYFILIVAGRLIGRRALLLFGSASTLALLIVGWVQVNGWAGNHFGLTPTPIAVITAAFFLLGTTFGLNFMVVRLNRAVREAQQNADSQAKTNQELRQLEAQLEERIAERTAELDYANQQLEMQLNRISSLQEKLRQEAIRDPLTGLFNRRYLDEALPIELGRCERTKDALTVLMLDIDHFKPVNDTHGHQVGDAVLVAVAAALKKSVRIGDIVCRYGGEEFLLVLPGMKNGDAKVRAEILRTMVGLPISIGSDGLQVSVTISIGGSIYPQDARTPDELIHLADQALYKAKQNGRNRVEFS